jgi:ankyrin repeat protein
LFLAAKFVEVDIMRALAVAGAHPQVPASDGTTPLMAAAGIGWGNATTRRGEFVGAMKGLAELRNPQLRARALESVKLAVSLGADVNASNSAGETAIFGAVPRGLSDVVEFLVANGARLDVKNNRGQTPLALTRPRGADNESADPMLSSMGVLLRRLGATP